MRDRHYYQMKDLVRKQKLAKLPKALKPIAELQGIQRGLRKSLSSDNLKDGFAEEFKARYMVDANDICECRNPCEAHLTLLKGEILISTSNRSPFREWALFSRPDKDTERELYARDVPNDLVDIILAVKRLQLAKAGNESKYFFKLKAEEADIKEDFSNDAK